jgi:hypothetical protein
MSIPVTNPNHDGTLSTSLEKIHKEIRQYIECAAADALNYRFPKTPNPPVTRPHNGFDYMVSGGWTVINMEQNPVRELVLDVDTQLEQKYHDHIRDEYRINVESGADYERSFTYSGKTITYIVVTDENGYCNFGYILKVVQAPITPDLQFYRYFDRFLRYFTHTILDRMYKIKTSL